MSHRSPSRRTTRWAAPVAAATTVALSVLLTPALALADEPASGTWEGAESFYTPLYVLLVLVGGPVVIFLVVALLGSLGKHRTYPRPVLGEEAAIEAAEQHGDALRRSTGEGDNVDEVPSTEAAREREETLPT